jgi:hypothetical protein
LKTDKYIRDILDRLNAISNNNNSGNGDGHDDGFKYYDDEDEYYLDVGSEPLRFAYYRHVRIQNSKDEYRKKSYEAANDSITQDELDYYLKAKLRVPPEQRYQDAKENWFFHDSSSYARGLEAYDGYGCNNGECIESCRFYLPYGRIEDDEVIAEHRELEEKDRRNNTIVNIDIDKRDFLEFAKGFYNR